MMSMAITTESEKEIEKKIDDIVQLLGEFNVLIASFKQVLINAEETTNEFLFDVDLIDKIDFLKKSINYRVSYLQSQYLMVIRGNGLDVDVVDHFQEYIQMESLYLHDLDSVVHNLCTSIKERLGSWPFPAAAHWTITGIVHEVAAYEEKIAFFTQKIRYEHNKLDNNLLATSSLLKASQDIDDDQPFLAIVRTSCYAVGYEYMSERKTEVLGCLKLSNEFSPLWLGKDIMINITGGYCDYLCIKINILACDQDHVVFTAEPHNRTGNNPFDLSANTVEAIYWPMIHDASETYKIGYWTSKQAFNHYKKEVIKQ